jgi:hypothetical protein
MKKSYPESKKGAEKLKKLTELKAADLYLVNPP